MIEDIKLMLGDAANNYTTQQIAVAIKKAVAEVQSYCRRELDEELENVAADIAIIKLNRLNTEGLSAQSYSGVSETYINGYPEEIKAVLNRKRKIAVI